jgi:hypothetical protein
MREKSLPDIASLIRATRSSTAAYAARPDAGVNSRHPVTGMLCKW